MIYERPHQDHQLRGMRYPRSSSFFVSGAVGARFSSGMLGFPVAAKAAQDDAIFFANACAYVS
jgi:hypothetical protein